MKTLNQLFLFFTAFLCALSFNTQAFEIDHLYWQASMGFGKGSDTKMKDNSDNGCNSVAPPSLFGCGHHAKGDYSNVRQLAISLGYRWNDLLSTELSYDFQTMTFDGNANFTGAGNKQPVSADVIANSLLVNGKLDIITLFTDSTFPFRPFLTAGIGLSAISVDKVNFDFPGLQRPETTSSLTTTAGGIEFQAIYKFGLGIDWVFNKNMGVQFSYQYYDLGKLKTQEGIAYVYGHGCHKAGEPFGCNLYVDGLEADIKTGVFNVGFWKTF